MADLCGFYGLPAVTPDTVTVGEWLTQALGRPPIEGDQATLQTAELSVRRMHDGEIARVGIRLLSAQE
jgi:CBS domain containing-hemolysin-like protein